MRAILPLSIGVLLTACSAGASLPTFGLIDSAQNTDHQKSKVTDAAPTGSWESAPKGSFSDRDFSETGLDPQEALRLINGYRGEKGLRPLSLNSKLTAAAKAHSRDLAKWDRISHHGSDGSNPWKRIKSAGYSPSLSADLPESAAQLTDPQSFALTVTVSCRHWAMASKSIRRRKIYQRTLASHVFAR